MSPKGPALFKLRLTVKSGPDAGKTCEVDRDIVTVGKLPSCDLVLSHPTVSRRHLNIVRTQEDTWQIQDLGSTNGSFLGDARIQQAPIEAGAVFRAGKVEIAFAPARELLAAPEWEEDSYGELLGCSKAMRRLYGLIDRVAPTDATVLIQGETGTGKGALAKAIYAASRRAQNPYVVVDCGAVQRNLAESELFGHEQGAFSGAFEQRKGAFEMANSGTVFIDELSELELDLQPKLLRVLDAREIRRVGANKSLGIDIRVIAASRRDLAREVERGVFREDLFFRLSVVTLTIPPLRERPEDIPLLVEHFLKQAAEKRRMKAAKLEPVVLERLKAHDWPGNVRELRNVVERAVLLSAIRPGAALAFDELQSGDITPPTEQHSFDEELTFGEAKAQWMALREESYLRWLLDNHQGNISQSARAAQMDRKYLHKLIKKYELPPS